MRTLTSTTLALLTLAGPISTAFAGGTGAPAAQAAAIRVQKGSAYMDGMTNSGNKFRSAHARIEHRPDGSLVLHAHEMHLEKRQGDDGFHRDVAVHTGQPGSLVMTKQPNGSYAGQEQSFGTHQGGWRAVFQPGGGRRGVDQVKVLFSKKEDFVALAHHQGQDIGTRIIDRGATIELDAE